MGLGDSTRRYSTYLGLYEVVLASFTYSQAQTARLLQRDKRRRSTQRSGSVERVTSRQGSKQVPEAPERLERVVPVPVPSAPDPPEEQASDSEEDDAGRSL